MKQTKLSPTLSQEVQGLVKQLAHDLEALSHDMTGIIVDWATESDNDNKKSASTEKPQLISNGVQEAQIEVKGEVLATSAVCAGDNKSQGFNLEEIFEPVLNGKIEARKDLLKNVQDIMGHMHQASSLPVNLFLAQLEVVEFTIGKLFSGPTAEAAQALVQKLVADIYKVIQPPEKPAVPRSSAAVAPDPAPGS